MIWTPEAIDIMPVPPAVDPSITAALLAALAIPAAVVIVGAVLHEADALRKIETDDPEA